MKKNIFKIFLLFLIFAPFIIAQNGINIKAPKDDFVIKKPGEITFTSGLVIEGHVEKPQVLLVLTKEKIKLPPIKLEASMLHFIQEPFTINAPVNSDK